jgi:hypothetical protein
MSRKQLDAASQGIISARKIFGAMKTIPQTDGKAVIRGAGRDVAIEDNRRTKPRPSSERTTQEWRRG